MRRALVVDDDQTMVETIGDILGLRGWEVTGAHSGEEAIATTDREAFDCVIMDVKMGGIDGLNALRRMRRSDPDLPVILMTAYTVHELIAEAERDGVLHRIEDFRAMEQVGNHMANCVRDGQSIAFVTGRAGVAEAMRAYLRSVSCPTIVAASAEDLTASLRDEPTAIVWHQALPVVSPNGAVLISDTTPGALLAAWGVGEDQEQPEAPQLSSRFGCGYLRKPFRIENLFTTIEGLTA